jgi:hypothetical protein
MSSSQRVETTVQATADVALAPGCPVCGGPMVVRAHRHGNDVDGLFWGCKKPLVCSGTRKIRDPLVVQPVADASTMAIFEWERARDRQGWVGGLDETQGNGRSGLFGRFGKQQRPVTGLTPTVALAMQPDHPLDTLPEYGYVILDGRQVAIAHASVNHFVVGPTGVFVVDRKSWPGQISASTDAVFVDGRQRTGALDDILRATAAVENVLGHELKPFGASVRPVVAIDLATNRGFEATVGKVSLAATRSVARVIRSGQPVLGPETVVRLALAADRLLD